MNEFLTSYSSDHTLLWALLIIGAQSKVSSVCCNWKLNLVSGITL